MQVMDTTAPAYSTAYLRRRSIIRALFWVPVTAAGGGLIAYGLASFALAAG